MICVLLKGVNSCANMYLVRYIHVLSINGRAYCGFALKANSADWNRLWTNKTLLSLEMIFRSVGWPLLCVVSMWRTRCCEPEYPSGGPCVTPPDGNPEHHRCRIMSCQSEVQPCVSFQIKPMRSDQILLIYSTSCGLLYKILLFTCHHINASTNRGSSPFPPQPTLLYRIKLGFTVVIA